MIVVKSSPLFYILFLVLWGRGKRETESGFMSPGWVLCHCSRRGAFPSESLGDSFIILQSSVEGWGPLDEEEMNRKEYSWLKTASSLAGLVSF